MNYDPSWQIQIRIQRIDQVKVHNAMTWKPKIHGDKALAHVAWTLIPSTPSIIPKKNWRKPKSVGGKKTGHKELKPWTMVLWNLKTWVSAVSKSIVPHGCPEIDYSASYTTSNELFQETPTDYCWSKIDCKVLHQILKVKGKTSQVTRNYYVIASISSCIRTRKT